MADAAAMTLALYRAKQAVLADLRSKGEKIASYDRAERQRLAKAWLKANPSLIDEAQEWLATRP
jgi:hypothetical protein